MAFDAWKSALETYIASEPDALKQAKLSAQLSNLLSEQRVDGLKISFINALVVEYDRRCGMGVSCPDAAHDALQHTLVLSWKTATFILALSSPIRETSLFTYASSLDLAQLGGLGDIEVDDPPASIVVTDGQVFAGSRKRLVWVSPDTCPDDPNEVAKGLGLPHFVGAILFRFSVDANGLDIFVPTCFDARLYEAWQIALTAEASTVGRTRHVETGGRPFRELVAENSATQGRWHDGTRVPTGGPPTRVASMSPNYLLGRT